jgi:tRNA/tmRNA/rRNA uracil-C5-methylase (TrmA/RlmC/RlmD family)
LADSPVATWLAPVSGPEAGFRNKAKMVVSGSVERPLLGMLHRDGSPEDPPTVRSIRPVLRRFCRAETVYRPRRINAL